MRIPIATRIILIFLVIIMMTSVIFTVVGIEIISSRIVADTQETVNRDLNAARVIYQNKLTHINDIVRLTANRFYIKDALISGNVGSFAQELIKVKEGEGLDILNITDPSGTVILRANNIALSGDSQTHNALVEAALSRNTSVFGTDIMSAEDLTMESVALAFQARLYFVDTPKARPRPETEETAGMILEAASPIFDYDNKLIGILYGGNLLNRNYDIVDEVKQTVFQGLKYKNQDIGTATIFQDDVRISTNVYNSDGTRAIGTRVSQEVYNRVVVDKGTWIGPAYVVNNWYISAYEPIRDIDHNIIGILYVGILQQPYTDIRSQTILAFLGITLAGAVVTMVLSYLMSRSISVHIAQLVGASREIAHGNLKATVEISSNDELGELAETFNFMASSLDERNETLKEYTRTKIMESEKLALIGQLSANVAHELNNPLTGIVTYSHLLLEEAAEDDPSRMMLQKIVVQATRCRDIIRGLLDFSRQRKMDKTACDINGVLKGCVSLIGNQALFLNVQIEFNLAEKLPATPIDPSQIERVFINMIINAAEAMDGNGKLSLSTRYDPEGRCVEVEFADTGSGISKENLEKIFDPFFTTKDTGHGLGLPISYGIIKEHKGTIAVESEVGKGTTFIVRLPVDGEGGSDGK